MPYPSLRTPLLGVASAAAFLAVLVSGRPASAAPCEVRLAGPAAESWQRAVRDLAASLEGRNAGDCASIVVAANGNGARLVYTTRDGRTAERPLASPAELRPTAEALLAGSARATPETTEKPAPAHETNPPEVRTQPPVVVAATPERPPAPAPASRPVLSIGIGTRAGDHSLVTPMLEIAGSLDVTGWEVGVGGRWESGYHSLDDNPALRRASGMAAGVTLGRRDRLRAGVTLRYGVDVMLSSMDDDAAERLQAGHVGHAEARLGGYVGAVVPQDTSPRFRATLGADVLPTQVGQPEKDSLGQPLTPWIAATLVLGMELGSP